MSDSSFSQLLPQPDSEHEPVFAEPWQAQAFALTVRLHEQGCFSWREWADCLAAEIAAADGSRAADRSEPVLADRNSDTYYRHWLRALERLVTQKGLVSPDELMTRKQAWDQAARHTPHGKPIELPSK